MSEDALAAVAKRYEVSLDAAREVERALRATGGSQAQFSHPDLGGYGQWMSGMVMIGRMGDDALKARVAGLCAEIADLVRRSPATQSAGSSRDSSSRSFGGNWWPADLGSPSSAGGQNDVRYAYFAGKRRLLVERGGRVESYDTGEHQISGVSQQQGSRSRLAFTSQLGDVALEELKRAE